ncbi:MAG: aminomethyl-transferring glycine dehydrogenase [Planctomycetota bacterium]
MQNAFPRHDRFADRHLGPRSHELAAMLQALGCKDLDELTDKAIPKSLRTGFELKLPPAKTEQQAMAELKAYADRNQVWRSYLGMGYHGTVTPPVIQRNILENPGWYTQYTPYQAEISQGRMEALLNYQTLVLDLTGLQVANSSLLDEATAAAEAMTLCHRLAPDRARNAFFVDDNVHPQTLAVVQTRAEPLGIEVRTGDHRTAQFGADCFGALLQYPGSDGRVDDLRPTIERIHAAGGYAACCADLLALTLLVPPGEMGADVVCGSAQRFGVPLGYGGPHAAFMAAKKEFTRQLPGRIVGVTIDATGQPAMRLSLGTREQHIRREKATSNICTAQVLLAVMASMYAVYHGPDGLCAIAQRLRDQTATLAAALQAQGHRLHHQVAFDTLRVTPKQGAAAVQKAARERRINLRAFADGSLGVTLDETVDAQDLLDVLAAFGGDGKTLAATTAPDLGPLARRSEFLTHPSFHSYRSEHELLRYIHRLQAKDLSLTTSMIPLGSCTMKLNATAEMYPVSWPGFSAMHPFAPPEQAEGYAAMHRTLEQWLCEITGFAGCSLQPNAGSQGEYAGLLVIRAYHKSRGHEQRNVCLIPSSAHGTNPASASMCGMKVVVVACDDDGNIDLGDLQQKAEQHKEQLAALMVTYPSTHGVFEESIRAICKLVHDHGGQVYMDGANMNAQVGLLRPGDLGADVCHLNLHKTFCIPHGGGGPGMGPICTGAHLQPFLPGHPVVPTGGDGVDHSRAISAISAAPWGSASILPISYAYIAMMGADGLRRATQVAIAAANYVQKRLQDHYPVLYTGQNGMVAHECIVDVRHLKQSAGIEVSDIAKRLMDYGFHAPTISFPVAGTMMIEPTESEGKAELDRFCAALIAIRQEIREIEDGTADRQDNLLKNAPHTAAAVTATEWGHPYTRERAAFPAPWTKVHKFWPPVARVNDVHGDRNLVCACPPIEAYAD